MNKLSGTHRQLSSQSAASRICTHTQTNHGALGQILERNATYFQCSFSSFSLLVRRLLIGCECDGSTEVAERVLFGHSKSYWSRLKVESFKSFLVVKWIFRLAAWVRCWSLALQFGIFGVHRQFDFLDGNGRLSSGVLKHTVGLRHISDVFCDNQFDDDWFREMIRSADRRVVYLAGRTVHTKLQMDTHLALR